MGRDPPFGVLVAGWPLATHAGESIRHGDALAAAATAALAIAADCVGTSSSGFASTEGGIGPTDSPPAMTDGDPPRIPRTHPAESIPGRPADEAGHDHANPPTLDAPQPDPIVTMTATATATAAVAVAVAVAVIMLSVSSSGEASGTAIDDVGTPVVGATVQLVASSPGEDDFLVDTDTGADGRFAAVIDVPSGPWTVTATAGIVTASAQFTPSSQLALVASQPTVSSETPTVVTVGVRDRGRSARADVDLEVKESTDRRFRTLGHARTGAGGVAVFRVEPWRNPQYRVTATRGGNRVAVTTVGATPSTSTPVRPPRGAPEPRLREPLVDPPNGTGAHVIARPISNEQWASMVGRSWHSGCPPRAALRMVEMNYRGLDGYRHRGRITVNAAIARKAVGIFTSLYRSGYPIRQVRPVDYYLNRNRRHSSMIKRANAALAGVPVR